MRYTFKIVFFIILTLILITPSSWAIDDERRLEAVLIGRFTSFIDMPDNSTPRFVITVIDKNPFGTLLDDLYRHKKINGKPVEIKYATRIEEVGMSDIMVITAESSNIQQPLIDYALKHSILTISSTRGFAERGGIIQINFVNRRTKIKINYDAAIRSGLKIRAPLLSIATVIRGGGNQ